MRMKNSRYSFIFVYFPPFKKLLANSTSQYKENIQSILENIAKHNIMVIFFKTVKIMANKNNIIFLS